MKLSSISFRKPDPLGAGIREEIARQQANPESAIDLFDRPTGEELENYLENILAIDDGLIDELSLQNS